MSIKTSVSALWLLLGFLMFLDFSLSINEPLKAAPKVQIYSREPGLWGNANTLICHVSHFHPPELSVELLKDGLQIPESQQTDLAFEEDWHYHLTKHAPFTPQKEHRYSCRVTHLGQEKTFDWEADN